MFTIVAENTGKKFGREWIFRQFSCRLEQGKAYVITGPNGSGKSTLLQILSGFFQPTDGRVLHLDSDSPVDPDAVYRYFSVAAPYMELIEELSFKEAIAFHSRFKPFYKEISPEYILEISGLKRHEDKQLKFFSSGMKQRVKLLLSVLSDCPLLLLDEPLSNLDSAGGEWYRELILRYVPLKLCVVCSNKVKEEYFFCTEEISILDFK